jgi:hypothetical protein
MITRGRFSYAFITDPIDEKKMISAAVILVFIVAIL